MAERKEKQYVSDNAQLMAEWDWESNNRINLYPDKVTHGSTKNAHWLCMNGHRFSARIDHRTIMKSSCPYCAGKRPILGVNDLTTTHPALLKEWDYENNPYAPEQYLAGSNKKAAWVCCNCGHRWSASVYSRATANTGCPVCMNAQRGKTKTSNTLAKNGSLETQHPKLADEWNYEKNAPLTPADVHSNSKKKVWWICKKGHAWEAAISNRVYGNGCPVCANKTLLYGFNDLETTFPDIAKEWHPTLNGDLVPSRITAQSHKKVWWLCHKCKDEFFSPIYLRTSRGTQCPVCSNRKVRLGTNDLSTTHPALAKEWHPTKNGKLQPTEIIAGSNAKVWWCCEKGHSWMARIYSRKQGTSCPICSRKNETSPRTINTSL